MSEQIKSYRGKSLVWPLVLIGVGVVFLMDNLNMIDVDLWVLITRLWPLILVAVGLDILFGRRAGIWQGLSVLIVISLFAAGAWFVRNTGNLMSGELYTERISQAMDDVDQAKIDIDFGVGELEINALVDDDEKLIVGKLSLAEGEVLEQDYRLVGDTAYYQLGSHGPEFYPSWIFNDAGDARTWEIDLTDSVPLELEINTGVGQSYIDLRGLMISDLDVNTGVGEVDIYLPDSGDFSAHISGGIGQMTVMVPEGLAIRLHIDTGLGNTRVNGELSKQDGVYFSENYTSAENKVDLYVDGGIGEVVVTIMD